MIFQPTTSGLDWDLSLFFSLFSLFHSVYLNYDHYQYTVSTFSFSHEGGLSDVLLSGVDNKLIYDKEDISILLRGEMSEMEVLDR